ncbi:MAG: hypothetical protein PHQ96_05950 [Candidatus Omnitrophica bacterium]|nr:hypothetical protein [Candidatus Omnitrophota bacterium]
MKIFEKINIKKALTHNIWLKIASLIIAIIIWLYVSGEISRGVHI